MKPNIILIMTDQQSHVALGCAGNKFINTPAMDSIAANGIMFENAYCNNPVCVPSRVATFTGRYPHEAGIYSNTRKAPVLATGEFTWLGRLLADAGYQNVYLGKWHLILDPASWKTKKKTGFKEGLIREADHRLAGACDAFLKKWIAGGRTHPFFMVISFLNPHNVCQWARRQSLPCGPVGEPPSPDACPPLPANFAIQQSEPDIIREVQATYKNTLYPTAAWSDGEWRQYLWAYNRMVEKVDGELEKILSSIRETHIDDETVILFTSDHGEGLASHHWNQKQILYENVAKVPLLVQHGRTKAAGRKSSQLVATGVDIYATICDYASVPIPPQARGTSLRAIIEGEATGLSRDHVVTETEFGQFVKHAGVHHGRPNGRMVRTKDFKYIIYNKGTQREQLFDMRSDALEMHNLAFDGTHNAILEEHRALLAAWCKETSDDFEYIP
nr:sulfatase-like hydrolase/transferase [Candidatus Sigynarchaeota archaeon]